MLNLRHQRGNKMTGKLKHSINSYSLKAGQSLQSSPAVNETNETISEEEKLSKDDLQLVILKKDEKISYLTSKINKIKEQQETERKTLNREILKLNKEIELLSSSLTTKEKELSNVKPPENKIVQHILKIMELNAPARKLFMAIYQEIGDFNVERQIYKTKMMEQKSISFNDWKTGAQVLSDIGAITLKTIKPKKGRHKTVCTLHFHEAKES